MNKEFTVPGMSCQHCVNAVTKAVSALKGVERVVVNLNTKVVTVDIPENYSTPVIVQAIQNAGYDEVVERV